MDNKQVTKDSANNIYPGIPRVNGLWETFSVNYSAIKTTLAPRLQLEPTRGTRSYSCLSTQGSVPNRTIHKRVICCTSEETRHEGGAVETAADQHEKRCRGNERGWGNVDRWHWSKTLRFHGQGRGSGRGLGDTLGAIANCGGGGTTKLIEPVVFHDSWWSCN